MVKNLCYHPNPELVAICIHLQLFQFNLLSLEWSWRRLDRRWLYAQDLDILSKTGLLLHWGLCNFCGVDLPPPLPSSYTKLSVGIGHRKYDTSRSTSLFLNNIWLHRLLNTLPFTFACLECYEASMSNSGIQNLLHASLIIFVHEC